MLIWNLDICRLLILNNIYLLSVLDNGSQKHCLQEGFCEHVEREAASKRQTKHTWGIYSPQDFVTKLQRPCQDMVKCNTPALCVKMNNLLLNHRATQK